MLTKDLSFTHNSIELFATVEYSAGLYRKLDTISVLGGIFDNDSKEHEVSDKVIEKVFYEQYSDEIEVERIELIKEKTGKMWLSEELENY